MDAWTCATGVQGRLWAESGTAYHENSQRHLVAVLTSTQLTCALLHLQPLQLDVVY